MARNILAYFTTRSAAERAAAYLKNEGFDTVQIDPFNRFSGDGADHVFNPTTGNITSLANLTLGADVDAEEQIGPLLAADPSASGLAGEGMVEGYNTLLTVVPPDDNASDYAEQIVRSFGGLA